MSILSLKSFILTFCLVLLIITERSLVAGSPLDTLFPLENYWDLGYAHAPLTGKKYLPLLTSRGCPYPCGFCVVPSTNQRRWRFRSAENVVSEMQFFFNKYGVSEFHLEDLNPTIQKQRMKDISSEIISRNLILTWKIGS